MAILVLQTLHAIDYRRIGADVARIGGQEFFCKVYRAVDPVDDAASFGTDDCGVPGEQVAHGRKSRPPGLGIVADIEHAPHFELAADEVELSLIHI